MNSSPLSPTAHMSSAFALVGAVALAFTGLLVTATPAQAQGASNDHRCSGLVEQARTAAAGTEAKKQASASRLVSTGVKLCEAGNARAAAKQFRAVLKIAGVAEVAPDDARLAAR